MGAGHFSDKLQSDRREPWAQGFSALYVTDALKVSWRAFKEKHGIMDFAAGMYRSTTLCLGSSGVWYA